MSKVALVCAHCGRACAKETSHVNRQRRRCGAGVPFYCNHRCNGASKRVEKPKEQRIAEKAAYDRDYREKNGERRKAEKRAYYQRTYDPAKAREERKERAEWQRQYGAEYRKRPEWIAHKVEYDRAFRAAQYAEFAECHRLLIELEQAVRVQPWYERAKERGYYDNDRQPQQRKRNEQISRW